MTQTAPPTLTANEALSRLEDVAHRAQSEESAARKVSAAKTRLILSKDARSVFFASLVMRLRFSADWTIETAATDGRRLIYNPDFVLGLTDPELVGLMAHEVLHCANKHVVRRGERDQAQWNIACDLAINPLLTESGFTLPSGALQPASEAYPQIERDMSAEAIYAALTEKHEDEPEEQQPQDEPGDDEQSDDQQSEDDQTEDEPGEDDQTDNPGQPAPGNTDPGRCGGVIDPQTDDGAPVEPAEARQLDNEWSANIAAAQQVAQRRGELPGGLARLCAATLAPAADWKAELREFITRPAKNNYNWKRPNRRHVHAGIYLPSMHSLEIGHVIAAIDTSGSITPETLSRFASELADIAQQGISKLTILYHDSDIVRVDEWTPDDGPLTLTPCGGGGTDHNPVFAWIETNADEPPAVLVCLTDLYSCFPSQAPDYPVLWAATATQPHPFGERIDIPAV